MQAESIPPDPRNQAAEAEICDRSRRPWCTFSEAAQYLGISTAAFAEIVDGGFIDYLEFEASRRIIRFRLDDLDAIAAARSKRLPKAPAQYRKIPGARPLSVGWTYFVRAQEVGRIKIGQCAGRPSKRIEGLRTGSPVILEGIGALQSILLEPILHRKFDFLRWMPEREWFHAESVLTDFIRDTAIPFAEADSIEDSVLGIGQTLHRQESAKDRVEQWLIERGLGPIEDWKS